MRCLCFVVFSGSGGGEEGVLALNMQERNKLAQKGIPSGFEKLQMHMQERNKLAQKGIPSGFEKLQISLLLRYFLHIAPISL